MPSPVDPLEPAESAVLLRDLAGRNPNAADAAIRRIMQLGRPMVGALLRLRGAEEAFAGSALLNPRASMALPIPTPGFDLPPSQKHRVLTVEAAALYLVSALARGELHFAQAPLLVDPAEPLMQRTLANTPERVARAFDAAQQWYAATQGDDRQALATADADPIASSRLRWY